MLAPDYDDEIRPESSDAIPVDEYLTDPGDDAPFEPDAREGDDVDADAFGIELRCDDCDRPHRPLVLHRPFRSDPLFIALLCPACYDARATRAALED